MIKKILYKAFLFSALTVSIGCGVYASNYIVNLPTEKTEAKDIIEETNTEARKLCTVTDASKAYSSCSDGDIVLFAPSSWGNEQFPVKVAAYICNFDKPIVHTKGGVSCVFTSARG
jgi:hypothetical protein